MRPWIRLLTILTLLLVGAFAVLWDRGWRPADLLTAELRTAAFAPPERGSAAAPNAKDEPSRCERRLLARTDVKLSPVPDFSNARGCGYQTGLKINEIRGVKFNRPVVLNCEMAEKLDTWLEQDLKPLTERSFDTELVGLDHLGGYNCRTIAGRKRLSEHSFGNAIDLSAIRLKDGRSFQLEGNWAADDSSSARRKALANFWQGAARRACRRFHVVLTPAFNQAHADHFHLDLGPFRSCRV